MQFIKLATAVAPLLIAALGRLAIREVLPQLTNFRS